jgi:ABC-type multidrug transport system permease subunit
MNLTMLPMYVLSGVFFSSDRFPLLIQPLIKLLPLTALNDSLRGVINEGQGITDISGNLIILAIWTLAAFFMAMKLFRWR